MSRMDLYMNKRSSIGFAFTLIILLLLAQAVLSLSYLSTIATQVEKLYEHPYAVSNATRDIRTDLVSMHRYMKDVALAENDEKVSLASALVNEHEQRVLKSFELIFERYLGDSNDIQVAYKAFVDWKLIRDEVIRLKRKGHDKKAADITRGKGADHVALLNRETQKLVDFADNKAKIFLNNSVDAKSRAFFVVSLLMGVALAASILSAYYAVSRLNATQRDIKDRMHLIDQNILVAKLDEKGFIVDISSHLCRFFEVTKVEVLGRHASYLIHDDEREFAELEKIFRALSTGKPWAGEIQHTTAEGLQRWLHLSLHPDLDEDYNVNSYSAIINDLTDQKLSVTDALTGLSNRRYFDAMFDKEIKIAARNKTPITFAMIDIDYFKRYNDLYGHPKGDTTLTQVAGVLSASLMRPNDYAFRLGGEEFGVILSGLNAEQSFEFFDRIRNRIEKLDIEHSESDVSEFVTVSLGVYVAHDASLVERDQLYAEADNALYEAKKSRNHVVMNEL